MRHRDRPLPRPSHLIDCDQVEMDEMSHVVLNEKYKKTYSSWRNMKARAKKEGLPVEPEFTDFVSFLRHMGPRPGEEFTIDRRDRLTYGPLNCRWLDKRGQANNRSTTIFLTCDGVERPLSEWASITGQKRGTLAARHRNGWTDCEAIHGKTKEPKPLNFGRDPGKWRPWITVWAGNEKRIQWWEEAFSRQEKREQHYPPEYPTYPIRWFIRQLQLWIGMDGDFLRDNEGHSDPLIINQCQMRQSRLDEAGRVLAYVQAALPDWEQETGAYARRQRAQDEPSSPEESEPEWDDYEEDYYE